MLLYSNLLPYASRLPRGVDWTSQYWPDSAITTVITLVCFSAPALPLILGVYLLWKTWIPFLFSLVATSWQLISWHHDFDLSGDAQAGINLWYFIPGVATVAGLGALVVGLVIHFSIPKNWPISR